VEAWFRKAAFCLTRRNLLALSCTLVCAFGVTSVQAEVRKIDTAKGVVSVDEQPQRVITLSEAALDTALALGVTPVGSVSTRGATTVSAYLQEKAGKLDIVGTTREYNLESILALQPDLILAPATIAQDVYNILSKLAPTIVPSAKPTDDWRLTIATYAHALGKQDEIQTAFNTLDQRIAATREKLPAGQTVSVVRWMPQGPMTMSAKVFTGQILTQLGLSTPELTHQLGDKPHSDILSLENLGRIDADRRLGLINEEEAERRKQVARGNA